MEKRLNFSESHEFAEIDEANQYIPCCIFFFFFLDESHFSKYYVLLKIQRLFF